MSEKIMLNQIAPELAILTKECNVHSVEEYIALMNFATTNVDAKAMFDALEKMTGIEQQKLLDRAAEYIKTWPDLTIPTVEMNVVGHGHDAEGERTDVEFVFKAPE